MKRLAKSILGVTLLEVMLVLAIAAMIIVMSIRYYQTASSNQQANAFLAQVQGIVTAAEQMGQATGSYFNAVSGSPISSANLAPLLPANAFVAPWGATITLGNVSSTAFSMAVAGIPLSVCPIVKSKLSTNNHYSATATPAAMSDCPPTSTATWTFYYVANP